MPEENLDLGSQVPAWIPRGPEIRPRGPRGERGVCGGCARGRGLERPLGLGARTHLDEEVAHAQSSAPCHATLVHRLQILQGREGRGGGELLDGGLRCRWEEPAGSEGRGGGGEAEQGMGLRPKSRRLRRG